VSAPDARALLTGGVGAAHVPTGDRLSLDAFAASICCLGSTPAPAVFDLHFGPLTVQVRLDAPANGSQAWADVRLDGIRVGNRAAARRVLTYLARPYLDDITPPAAGPDRPALEHAVRILAGRLPTHRKAP